MSNKLARNLENKRRNLAATRTQQDAIDNIAGQVKMAVMQTLNATLDEIDAQGFTDEQKKALEVFNQLYGRRVIGLTFKIDDGAPQE